MHRDAVDSLPNMGLVFVVSDHLTASSHTEHKSSSQRRHSRGQWERHMSLPMSPATQRNMFEADVSPVCTFFGHSLHANGRASECERMCLVKWLLNSAETNTHFAPQRPPRPWPSRAARDSRAASSQKGIVST